MWAGFYDQRAALVGEWCADGLNWRSWSAAELTWVLYRHYCRILEGRELREFLKLCGDTAAVAAFDRQAMGQTGGIDFADIPVKGGRRG